MTGSLRTNDKTGWNGEDNAGGALRGVSGRELSRWAQKVTSSRNLGNARRKEERSSICVGMPTSLLGLGHSNGGLQALLENVKCHDGSLKIPQNESTSFSTISRLWKQVIRSSEWQADDPS